MSKTWFVALGMRFFPVFIRLWINSKFSYKFAENIFEQSRKETDNNLIMTKKVILITALLGFQFHLSFAQDRAACEKIVMETVNAINNKTTEQLEKHLAPDFVFSGQKDRLAKIVLKQLIIR
jgi:hypothetical protein